MKVVHLVPAMEQGGVETVVCDLVKALGGRAGTGQWESVVVSKGGRLVERIEAAGGRHVTLDLKSKNPLTYFARAWELRRILMQENPDLVCVHSRVPAWLFMWANRGIGRKWISYAHGANSVSRYSAVMTKGDLVVTPSRFLSDYLKANYGTPDAKIRIVPNAVDTDRFDPSKLDQAFIAEKRREWGVVAGEHVTMAIGRITPVKGLEDLIRSFLNCQSGNQTVRPPNKAKLIIVGGADRHHLKYLESLKALAEETGRGTSGQRQIVFAGHQSKIPECLAIADEVVSANVTKPETFGLSVAEAYAMNRTVRVFRRFGGVAEVMDAVEKSGCATSREAVLKLYGFERWVERTLSVYREAIRRA